MVAQTLHPQSATALEYWYRLTKKAAWGSFLEVCASFSAVDKVGDKFVFDIGGSKLRLIAAIHFSIARVFVCALLIHRE